MNRVLKRVGALLLCSVIALTAIPALNTEAAVKMEKTGSQWDNVVALPEYTEVREMTIDKNLTWLKNYNPETNPAWMTKLQYEIIESDKPTSTTFKHNLKEITNNTSKYYEKYLKRSLTKFFESAEKNASKKIQYKLTFAKGTYNLEDSFKIPNNTYIYAVGSTFKPAAKVTTCFYNVDKKTGENIIMEGGTWDVSKVDLSSLKDAKKRERYYNVSMAKFLGVDNLVLKNITLKCKKKQHMIEFAGINNLLVSGCKFSGNNMDSNAAAPENVQTKEALQLDVATTAAMGSFASGCASGMGCHNVLIEKCKFTNCSRGVGSHSAKTAQDKDPYTNITITGCTFNKMLGEAIFVQNWKNGTISNNKISNCKRTGIMMISSSYNLLTGNTVKKVKAFSGARAAKYKTTVCSVYLYQSHNNYISKKGLKKFKHGIVYFEGACNGNNIAK